MSAPSVETPATAAPSVRAELPNRRRHTVIHVRHATPSGDREYAVSYSFDTEGMVREIFCHPMKTGSELDALLADACIGFSHLLQRGQSITELAAALGQLRPEGANDDELYPPASPLGAIVRAGAAVEQIEREERARDAQQMETVT